MWLTGVIQRSVVFVGCLLVDAVELCWEALPNLAIVLMTLELCSFRVQQLP